MKFRLLMVYLARYPLYPGFVSGGERHFIEILRRAKIDDCEFEKVPLCKECNVNELCTHPWW